LKAVPLAAKRGVSVDASWAVKRAVLKVDAWGVSMDASWVVHWVTLMVLS
jgi:hypothetical protein